MHVHAFSPMEVLNGATKLGISLPGVPRRRRARTGSARCPGTAAEILDDDVRWVLTKGKLPADTWEEIVRTAHGLGIRSSSTIMFGHVDAPPHWVAHIRAPRRASRRTPAASRSSSRCRSCIRTRRSTSRARRVPAPTFEDNLRMHAVARILLDGLIPNVQVSWVKLGSRGVPADPAGGANDFGGTLMEETISRMAGAEWGICMTPDRFDDAIRAIGRVPAVRTTTYERAESGG